MKATKATTHRTRADYHERFLNVLRELAALERGRNQQPDTGCLYFDADGNRIPHPYNTLRAFGERIEEATTR